MLAAIPGFIITLVALAQTVVGGKFVHRATFNMSNEDKEVGGCSTFAYLIVCLGFWLVGLITHVSVHPHITFAGWAMLAWIIPDVITAVILCSLALLVPSGRALADRVFPR